MSKRKDQRFVRRLETEFSADGKKYRGISSDLSRGGLFIRTNHAFAPGTLIDILIHLPDGSSARMKGRVQRSLKTRAVSLKNGMGIELVEKDDLYTKFLGTFFAGGDDVSQQSAGGSEQDEEGKETLRRDLPEYVIVACSKCTTNNKVNCSKLALGPKCGKCGYPIIFQG